MPTMPTSKSGALETGGLVSVPSYSGVDMGTHNHGLHRRLS